MFKKFSLEGVGISILTWEWTKKLLYWIVLSAGTMSELVFLIASLWVTINASVHGFVLLFVSEQVTIHLSQLATVAFVGLPECILALAIVTTIGHIRVWLYDKQDKAAATWAILYGIPTVIFLVLSLITIANSMVSTNFILPQYMVITRGLAGYAYGIIALLYTQLGKPQEQDRLAKKDVFLAEITAQKDSIIAELQKETARLANAIAAQNSVIDNLKHQLAESKNEQSRLIETMHKSSGNALQAYSEECIAWLKSGIKTVNSDEINRFTGHSKRKIAAAIEQGKLQTAPRNKELILVSSLVEWLKVNQPMTRLEPETSPLLHIVNR